jgi:serine/threonine protein kinase
VGVILFELLAGFPPFIGKNKAELRLNIEKGIYKFPPGVKVSKICLHLVSQLLQSEPKERIAWQKFFEHPFIKSDEKTYQILLNDMMGPS